MRKSLIAAIALTASAALAEGKPGDAGKRLVDEFVADVITLDGRFEQTLIDADGFIVEQSTGTLQIQRPGRFRWSYLEPYEQWLVADGLNIWSYDVDLAQVTVKPQSEALASTPALLLGGSADALAQFDYDGSYVQEHTTWARMSPKNTDSGFVHVELGFVDERLSRMVFRDTLEQTTVVVLTDVAINEPIDPGRFQFTVPDDADLVGIPAVAEVADP